MLLVILRNTSDAFDSKADVCSRTPYEYDVWVFDVMQSCMAISSSIISAIGPLVSIAFPIVMSVIEDPESFRLENILK